MSSNDLETYLYQHIPLSAAMGVKVDLASCDQIILSAPLSNNINHKKTVFGGSLHAVCTLACWSLLHVNLGEKVQIVISSSEISYKSPVTSKFRAECCLPNLSEWNKFQTMFLKKGKARITLNAKIFQNDRLCVDFNGVFVAFQMLV